MTTKALPSRRIQSLSGENEHVTQMAVEEDKAGCFVVNLRIFAEAMVHAVLAKCSVTHGHCQRVAIISYTAAHGLGLKQKQANYYYIAGLLHDIGKIGLSDTILIKLRKNEALTYDEDMAVRRHPHVGAKIIDPLDRIMHSRDGLSRIIMHHHELYDGTGYPGNLRSSQIPLGARIVSCADALSARLERGDTFSESIRYIAIQESGKYDPKIIAAIEKYRAKAEICLADISKKLRNA